MMDLSNFIYMEKNAFVFAYIPKAACTNWKCLLRYLKGYENYLDGRLSHHPTQSGLTKLSQTQDAWSILNDSSIAKYTFIRNPYTRVLSAYLNKVKPFSLPHAKPEWDPYYHRLYAKIDEYRKEHHPGSNYVEFRVFLEWVASGCCQETGDEHWRPFSQLIGPDPGLFNYIGRFENISIDAPCLLEKMGCDIPFPTQEQISFNPTHASKSKDIYYGVVEKELALRIFAEDFANYGYECRFEGTKPE